MASTNKHDPAVSFDSNEKAWKGSSHKKFNFTKWIYPADLATSSELTHYIAFYISVPQMRYTSRASSKKENFEIQKDIRDYLSKAPSRGSDMAAELDRNNKQLGREENKALQYFNDQGTIDPKLEKSTQEVENPKFTGIDNPSAFMKSLMKNRYVSAQEAICLYIPESLSTGHNLQWQADTMRGAGMVGEALKDIFSEQNTGNTGYGQIIDEIVGVGNDIGAAGGAAVQAAVSKMLSSDLGAAVAKVIQNPYMEILFKGVSNRKLDLQFKFTPRNKKEAIEVHNIIKTFKKYAHPKLPGPKQAPGVERSADMLKTFFLYPAEWDIKFYTILNGKSVENQFLSRYGRSVLDNIRVDYGAAGSTSFLQPFADDSVKGAPPVETDLTLSFTEIDLLTADMIEDSRLGF